jgi:DNA-binding transcriptional MerR regulator
MDMRIGELSDRTGLSQSRIRFYEKVGLLKAVNRRSNGYRDYPPEAVVILELIATAQSSGFGLEEIRALLPNEQEQWNHGALLDTLRRKVADITSLEARLKRNKAQLITVINEIEARPDDIDCATNARRVLSRLLDSDDGCASSTASASSSPARR